MKRTVGRPSREEQALISARLLDAARAAFCRYGMVSASMDKIAAEAAVTKHTIYRRYDSKEQLLDAVIVREVERIARSVHRPKRENLDPLSQLRAMSEAKYVYSLEAENVAFTSFLRAESTFSPKLLTKLADWDRSAIAPFIEIVVDAQVAGQLRESEPVVVCDVLDSLIDGSVRWWRWGTPTEPGIRDRVGFFEERWALFLRAYAA